MQPLHFTTVIALVFGAGCAGPAGDAPEGDPTLGCLHKDLGDWCYHSDQAEGPQVPLGADECEAPDNASAVPYEGDDRYTVHPSGPNFAGLDHFFDAGTAEHVAAMYWTDVNDYCDGYKYWYGQRID
jgi:hypothetical protein